MATEGARKEWTFSFLSFFIIELYEGGAAEGEPVTEKTVEEEAADGEGNL